MKAFKPKPEMRDTRTLSEKMQEQEKKAQAKEAQQDAAAKSEARMERMEAEYTPTRYSRKVTEAEGETDFAFLVENRLTEISNQILHLTGLIVDRLPKVSKVDKATENAAPPVKTVNGGHPVLNTGAVAPFIEVPSLETVMKAAKAYKERHNQEALINALKPFGVVSISKLNDEQKAQFLEHINDKEA